jgi:hypothetical protein
MAALVELGDESVDDALGATVAERGYPLERWRDVSDPEPFGHRKTILSHM